jgi:hypothetical protein
MGVVRSDNDLHLSYIKSVYIKLLHLCRLTFAEMVNGSQTVIKLVEERLIEPA